METDSALPQAGSRTGSRPSASVLEEDDNPLATRSNTGGSGVDCDEPSSPDVQMVVAQTIADFKAQGRPAQAADGGGTAHPGNHNAVGAAEGDDGGDDEVQD